jgi:hypothetical protein
MLLHHTLASHQRAPSMYQPKSSCWWRREGPSNPSTRRLTNVDVVFDINFVSLQLQSDLMRFVDACN